MLPGNDLYLVARRDPDGPYWNKNLTWLPWELQHDINLASYSLRPHRTSLFRVRYTLLYFLLFLCVMVDDDCMLACVQSGDR